MNKQQQILAGVGSRIYNTPLLISAEKLDAILGAIGGRIGLDVSDIEPLANLEEHAARNSSSKAKTTANQIAIISISGTLVHKTRGLMSYSGMQSYEGIRETFREVMKDPDVAAILFDISSGGGEVAGCFDLCDEIYAARGEKPSFAFANEHAYSAAYAIGSSTGKLFVARTGGVGSVGVRSLHVDQSGWDKKIGVKYTPIFAGEAKNDFDSHQPLPDKVLAKAQSQVVKIYDIFADLAARNRNMTSKEIKETQANLFMGEDAVKIGLADDVLTFDQVIEHISANINKNLGGTSMNALEKQMRALMKGSSEEENKEALEAIGYVAKSDIPEAIDAEALVKEANEKGAAASTKLAADICALAKLADIPGMAGELITSNASIEEAGKKLQEAKAANLEAEKNDDETVTVVSHQPGGDDDSPVIANAKKRAEKATSTGQNHQ